MARSMHRTYKTRFASGRAILALLLREMASTYGRSPGGYIWAILEPVAGISVFSFVFGFLVSSPPLGESFGLFFATGFLPLAMYQNLVVKVGTSLKYSRPFLTYPNVTYMDAIISRIILAVLTHLVIFAIIIAGIVYFDDLRLLLDYPLLARGFLMASAMGIAIGLVNTFLMGMFPIWQFVWAVINRPLFIVSGVLFLVDDLPEEMRYYLLLNPLTHVIMRIRTGIFSTYDGSYISELYVYLIAFSLAALGLALLNRYHSYLLDEGG